MKFTTAYTTTVPMIRATYFAIGRNAARKLCRGVKDTGVPALLVKTLFSTDVCDEMLFIDSNGRYVADERGSLTTCEDHYRSKLSFAA